MRVAVSLAMALVTSTVACAPRPTSPPIVPSPPLTLPSPPAEPPPTTQPPEQRSANSEPAPDFARDVQPILARACNPCHFPGGKMYQPMPFDDPNTVASHKEGVLRRLKGSDRTSAERWMSTLP